MTSRFKILSFDVFGTLISVREGSYQAFHSILRDCNAGNTDVAAFWEYWEERNIAHYWEPYCPYKDICALSLEEAFVHFQITGRSELIQRCFDAFNRFELYPDVLPTLVGSTGSTGWLSYRISTTTCLP